MTPEEILQSLQEKAKIKSKIEGICLSDVAPKNTNVLWIQYDNEGKFTLNIYWCNHWHPICSEAQFNEIIKKLKQLVNNNDIRLLQIINNNLKKVTYIDNYTDIDINPLSDEMIIELLHSTLIGNNEDLPEIIYGDLKFITDEMIINIWNETIEKIYDTGN